MVRVCFFEKKIIFDKKYDDVRAFDGTCEPTFNSLRRYSGNPMHNSSELTELIFKAGKW